ncbi:Cyclin-like domain-containing protein [Plasmodiophora brassicae]|uniref:Cyclin-like domain-containing protein n=1 Tax=Plasmodiophora brassicae TaxID=37360 RepID=A0A0G4IS54_PLABS|nr:hypothetical protein PBRA_006151 [Plasmodiophora brassicae]SPQ96138.1 unnamed protein product [Plasmodiophora brassicae]
MSCRAKLIAGVGALLAAGGALAVYAVYRRKRKALSSTATAAGPCTTDPTCHRDERDQDEGGGQPKVDTGSASGHVSKGTWSWIRRDQYDGLYKGGSIAWVQTMLVRQASYARALPTPGDLGPPNCRTAVVLWMHEACRTYRLTTECLHHAVDYLDRFLLLRPDTTPFRCRVVGAAAVLVASKILDQGSAPPLDGLCKDLAGACVPGYLVRVETGLCDTLQWRLHPTLAVHWAELYLVRALDCSEQGSADRDALLDLPRFARVVYLLTKALLYTDRFRFKASVLAAATLHLVYDGQRDLLRKATGVRPVNNVATCMEWVAFLMQDS